jgi:hypothetical protein
MLEHMASRTYRPIVEGDLSDRLTVAFEGMTFTRSKATTALTGHIRDQAELQGLLRRVSDLGLTLLEATAIDVQTECGSVAPRPPDPQRRTD